MLQEHFAKNGKKNAPRLKQGAYIVFVAERKGFEPPRRVFARLLDFESSAFNRTLPSLQTYKPGNYYTIGKICQC